jgi:hypothetical protein
MDFRSIWFEAPFSWIVVATAVLVISWIFRKPPSP